MSDISSINSTSSTSSSYSTPVSSTPSTSSSTGQVLRITGMNSGIDVDSTVTKLMAPYQLQIDKVQQDVQKVQWGQQMYENIINDAKTFQSTYFNSTDPSMDITSPSFFNTTNVSSSSTAVSAIGSSSATLGTYTISVNNLAAAPTIQGGTLNTEAKVSDFSNWSNGTLNLSVGSNATSISLGNITPTGDNTKDTNTLVSAINNAISSNSTLNGNLYVSSITDSTGTYIKFNSTGSANIKMTDSSISDLKPSGTLLFNNIVSVNSNTTMANLGFNGTSTLNLTYNSSSTPVAITVTDSETLSQLTADISAKTNGSVIGKFDDITGKFVLNSNVTGSQSTLSVTNSSPTTDPLLKALGLSNSNLTVQGQDSNVTISAPGGISETISKNSNTLSLNGLSLTLNNTTDTGSPTVVNVTSDPSTVFTKFKGFMDKYNSLVTEINTKVTEKTSQGYPPLTDAQKSTMSATDIQAWNAKAQQGLLHNDINLSNMLSSLKDSLYDAVKGTATSFGSKNLGVDLSDDFSKDGTLVFTDETGDTFKQELQNHSQDVTNLFTQSAPVGSTSADKYANEGISQRLNDIIVNSVGITGVTSTDSTLGKMAYKQDLFSTSGVGGTNTFLDQLFQDNSKITSLKSEYTTKQTAYYQQFSNLDTMLSQLNSESSSITQMLSGG